MRKMRSSFGVRHEGREAFTLVEVLVAVGIVGVMFVSLYAGMSSGFAIVQLARENLRATQILQEKMETIRLYRWDQINQAGFIATNFTDVFYSNADDINTESSSLVYTGRLSIVTAPISETYSTDMRLVTIQLEWLSTGVVRKREMQTFVSKYGLQNYVY